MKSLSANGKPTLEPKLVRSFEYKGLSVEIYETEGIFTATIYYPPGATKGVSWSLNTFQPETVQDAIKGAKHIIDHPPRFAANFGLDRHFLRVETVTKF